MMMKRALSALLLTLLGLAPVLAEVWPASYGIAETFNFRLYNSDGTLDVDEADGGTEVSLSCDEGAETTATNDFVDEGTFYSIALTAAELRCKRVAVVVAATTTEVFFIRTDSPGMGVSRQGLAQSATGTTLVMDTGAAFADDTAIGMTVVACGSTQGYCQARAVTDNTLSSDTLTVDTWTVTPSGTITFHLFGTAPSSGSGATAADVWAYGTRTITALDEDSTTIDLNASYVGGVTVFDEDLTTMDINATTLGTVTTVTTATNLTNLPAITANWLTATGIASDAITDAKVASDVTIASVTGAVGSVTGNVGGNVTGTVGTVNALAANSLTAAAAASDLGTEIGAAVLAAQGIITGTCDSGSTTTCVDNALTQADASQLEDRLICFDDAFCALLATFAPGSDTATTTKVAPSTRASKVYTIFPTTLE